MKDNKKNNTASARTLKAGGYSVVMTAILLAALIFVNLIVNSLPSNLIKLDTSSKKLFTLDTQSEEIIRSVKEDVTIYHVAQSGYVLDELTELLARYSSGNSKIKIKTVDPAVSPNFIAQFTDEALEDNSLIVVSDKRVKVVPYSEIVYTTYSDEDYYNYYYYGVVPQGETVFAGENAVTSAIDYVTVTDIPKVYALTGHGETALSETYLGYLKDENFEYDTLSLISSSSSESLEDELVSGIVQGTLSVPEDADLIVINGPSSDLSDSELEAILGFVREGGSVVVCAGYKIGNLPNFVKLASALGLDVCGGIVVEGSSKHYTQNKTYYLLPDIQSHEITDPIAEGGKRVITAFSHAMRKAEALPDGVDSVTPLLLTSENAVGKADPNAEKIYYENGDMLGQFVSAAAIEIGNGKAVWFASAYLADDTADSMVSGANADMFLNSLGWCCEKANSVSIRTISLSIQPLIITEGAANTWLVILCAVIPLAVVGGGFAVWFRRRSR
ncbi:MAG: Gldg family protein [Clostridia bacterium]|nr:Gldg family protein [Clostridia bacterium]